MLNLAGISHQQCAGRAWSKIGRIMEKVYIAMRLWRVLTYVKYIYICCCGSFVDTKVWNAIRREISCKITSIYLCINTNQIKHVIIEWKQAYGELLCTIILYIIICVAIIWKDNGAPMFIFHEPHMHICASQIHSSSFSPLRQSSSGNRHVCVPRVFKGYFADQINHSKLRTFTRI